MTVYRSYVAIGDSLSEGLGDFEFDIKRERAGWTDRLAALLAKQAETNGHEFHYANLAIRGSKLPEIMSKQLEAALSLKPDLVTVMAGANDLMKSYKKYPELERQLFEGIRKLQDAGCHVLVANTINPLHLRVFKAMATRAVVMTNLIERTAAALNAPGLDVFRIDSLKELCFWAEDMVHFSGHGHARVANRAADVLELDRVRPTPLRPNEVRRTVAGRTDERVGIIPGPVLRSLLRRFLILRVDGFVLVVVLLFENR
jgi:lysophospholipase L1-like esterase